VLDHITPGTLKHIEASSSTAPIVRREVIRASTRLPIRRYHGESRHTRLDVQGRVAPAVWEAALAT